MYFTRYVNFNQIIELDMMKLVKQEKQKHSYQHTLYFKFNNNNYSHQTHVLCLRDISNTFNLYLFL